MGAAFPGDVDYLVFSVNRGRFGVPHFNVVSVMDLPPHTSVPYMPPEVRGIIPFRETSIPLVDLRVSFGLTARTLETQELIANMAARKQDHINWVNKLKDEVLNSKPITVQTNPHLCAFGKWYDKFETDNGNLGAFMKRFDDPHQQIHRVGVEAARLIQQGKNEQAVSLIRSTESGVLVRLLELFDGIEGVVHKYLLEYAIIVVAGGSQFAIAVDDINFFSRLEEIEHPLPTGISGENSDLVQGIARYQDDTTGERRDVLLLDLNRIVNRIGDSGTFEEEEGEGTVRASVTA
ncbi:MAG: chemotaxis protein CheW [Magnetococcales bacterium]|nr:chemotaxis protein CheW [Magnetococcales bacterium]